MQTKSVLSGKEIDLTSDDIVIKSNNFNVDKDGKMQCNNANITGGEIKLSGGIGNPKFTIYSDLNSNIKTQIDCQSFDVYSEYDSESPVCSISSVNSGNGEDGFIKLTSTYNFDNETSVASWGINTPILTQTSLESKKKNFEKFLNGLDVVKNAEIYKYNFKGEKDTDKKHIGFVISNEGGNYKTPDEVIAKSGDGIDTYTMTSILWKAVQELTEKVEDLERTRGEK